ncbi:hypothetical protein K6Y31_20685 [Motilimonas cestriensis]|uniref:Tip attachment protein J second Ig-like domain-containing protein n=1 Tax=Motilimonas cestriensis TaxID=2742685 RepID=A0ABS8WDS4_9GAMM|nr:phage tail protein [Motilimonas cestriensis]MCE2597194.1 hypothetical protein [Motilimonas cestriensis]
MAFLAIPIVALGGITVGSAIAIGVAVAASGYSVYAAKKMSFDTGAGVTERKQVFRAAAAPIQIIYGQAQVAGPLIYAEEHGEPDEYGNGEQLHMIVPLAGHACSDVTELYLNDIALTADSARAAEKGCDRAFIGDKAEVYIYLGNHASVPTAGGLPSWQSEMIGHDICFAHVVLTSDREVWSAGVPNVKATVKGKAVYDPRDQQTRWSENAALIKLDYTRYFVGATDDEIDWSSFITAANECDEQLEGERRYRIGAAFDATATPKTVMAKMDAACAGNLIWSEGRYVCRVGAYYGPAPITLTQDDVIGDPDIAAGPDLSERFNTVTGTFVDQLQNFAEVDFPAVSIAEYVTDDGEEIARDLDLTFCPSSKQAQRVAAIHSKLNRRGIRCSLSVSYRAFKCRPGTVIALDLPALGWAGKEFRVLDWSFSLTQAITLELAEELQSNYLNYVTVEQTADTARTQLKGPNEITAPQNPRFVEFAGSDLANGMVRWDVVPGALLYHIEIYQDGAITDVVQSRINQWRVTNMAAGSYSIKIYAENSWQVRSPATTLALLLTLPGVPAGVTVDATNFALTLSPYQTGQTGLGTEYDVFWSKTNNRTQAKYLGRGRVVSHVGLSPNTTFYYWVSAVNRYGQSAEFAFNAKTLLNPSDLLDVLEGAISSVHLNSETQALLNSMGRDLPNMLASAQGELTALGEQILDNAARVIEQQTETIGDKAALAIFQREVAVNVDDAVASAQEYTRSAIGYCVDSEGNPVDENSAESCVLAGYEWVKAPLSETIRRNIVNDGNGGQLTLTQIAQTFINKDGKAIGRGGFLFDSHGRVSGLAATTNGDTTEIAILADKFLLLDPDNPDHAWLAAVENPDGSKQLIVRGRVELGDGTLNNLSDVQSASMFRIGSSTGVFPPDHGIASALFSSAAGRAPLGGDVFTVFKNDDHRVADTRIFNEDNAQWEPVEFLLHGDMLANGSVTADVLRAFSRIESPEIVGGMLNIGNGKAVINNNGDVYFANGTFGGNLVGGTLNIGGGRAVIDKQGNAYFENGTFGGTVYADKIVGDIVSAKAMAIYEYQFPQNNTWHNLFSATLKPNPSHGRTLIVGGVLAQATAMGESGGANGSAGATTTTTVSCRVLVNYVEVYRSIITSAVSGSDESMTSRASSQNVTIAIPAGNSNVNVSYQVFSDVTYISSGGAVGAGSARIPAQTTSLTIFRDGSEFI